MGNELQNYYKEYCNLSIKKNLSGVEALVAVQQDGYALRYVRDDLFIKE